MMLRRSSIRALALASVLALGCGVSAAQTAPQARGNRGAAMSNAELGTLLDAYAIVQAQRALQLDDEQYGRFVTRLKQLQDVRRRNTQARNRLLQEVRRLANDPAAGDDAIRERLKALRDLDEESARAARRAHDAVDEVLDARQQARFRVFEEQLERRKLDLLMRARERAGQPAPRRQPGQTP